MVRAPLVLLVLLGPPVLLVPSALRARPAQMEPMAVPSRLGRRDMKENKGMKALLEALEQLARKAQPEQLVRPGQWVRPASEKTVRLAIRGRPDQWVRPAPRVRSAQPVRLDRKG